jgi:hypothetical protein
VSKGCERDSSSGRRHEHRKNVVCTQFSGVPEIADSQLHPGNKPGDYYLFEPSVEERLQCSSVWDVAFPGSVLKTMEMMATQLSN